MLKSPNIRIKSEFLAALLISGVHHGNALICCPLILIVPQPKVGLIIDVVQGLGIEKAFELFNDTAEIQSNGGQIAAEGNYKSVDTLIEFLSN